MMEVGSFTSEPQYQRPDDKNDMVHYIARPEPVQAPVVTAPVAPPMPAPIAWKYLDPNMARPLLYKVNDTFLWSVILLFGGLGQITAGFLEYCKGRTFPCTLYLCLGFYCLTHYAYFVIPSHLELNYFTDMYYTYDDNSMAAFYAGWCFIAFALVIGSVRSNLLYILQVLTCFAFFLLRAIGEGCGSRPTKFHAAGILEVISGFFSLFVGISQILNNETCYRMCFPTCPMSPDNEIDMLPPYLMIPGSQPPVMAPPVMPVQPVEPVVPVLAQPPVVPAETPVIPVDPPVVPVEQQVPNI